MKKNSMSVQRMTVIAMFAALMCICAWIAVPSPFAPGVSFTLQTFAIILTGLVLSPADAMLSSLIYLMLGIIALPVFQNFTTLYSKIGAPSGGYIIGFMIAPVLISLCRTWSEKTFTDSDKKKTAIIVTNTIIAIVLGILVIDVPGVIQYKIVSNSPWNVSIMLGAVSFMPTDLIKCVLAAIVAISLKKPLKHLYISN